LDAVGGGGVGFTVTVTGAGFVDTHPFASVTVRL
jgi:hypothetical protein